MSDSLNGLLEASFDAFMANVHTAMPGTIKSYDYEKRLAEVTPSVQRTLPDGTALAMPVVVEVPVIFPCTEDTLIHFPLKKGDGVLLIFSERGIEKWHAGSGGDDMPGDPRRFSISDAIAIPGLRASGATTKAASGNGLEILYKKTKITLDTDIDIDNDGKAKGKFKSDGAITFQNDSGKFEMASGGTVTINNNVEILV